MPNWTQNDLVITGTKEAIDGVYGLLGDKFDFNKIIPMPKELQDDTHGINCPKCGKKFERIAMNSQSENKILSQGLAADNKSCESLVYRFGITLHTI